jgi:hypothetical protein
VVSDEVIPVPVVETAEILGCDPEQGLPVQVERWVARRTLWILSSALVLLLVLTTVLASMVYLDHRDTPSDADKTRIAAVLAYVDAMNAHDLHALHRATTASTRCVFLGDCDIQDYYDGSSLDDATRSLFDDGLQLTVVRPLQVGTGASANQVWALIHLHSRSHDHTNHQVFYLQQVDGTFKVDALAVHD